MTVALAILIMAAPFAVAAALSWAVNRSHTVGAHAAGFRVPVSAWGRLFDNDRDAYRVDHDLDAVRTRFERTPAWPASGVLGERR